MRLEKASHFIQIASSLGLLVGIVLVVIELNQAKSLSQAQLTSDAWRVSIDRLLAQMGEQAPAALAKACNNLPLTEEDKVVLSSRYQLQLAVMARDREVGMIANFADTGFRETGDRFYPIFATETGRRWWQSERDFYHRVIPEIATIGDAILKDGITQSGCGLGALDPNEELP